MLDKKRKERLIEKFRTHDNDTGSAQVQIAILSAEIDEVSKHLIDHKKDHSSRKGLLHKVSERRRLLKAFKREDSKGYEELAAKLKMTA